MFKRLLFVCSFNAKAPEIRGLFLFAFFNLASWIYACHAESVDENLHDAKDRHHDKHPDYSPDHMLSARASGIFIVGIHQELQDAINKVSGSNEEHQDNDRIDNDPVDSLYQIADIGISYINQDKSIHGYLEAIWASVDQTVCSALYAALTLRNTKSRTQELDQTPDRNNDEKTNDAVDHRIFGFFSRVFVFRCDIFQNAVNKITYASSDQYRNDIANDKRNRIQNA